MTCIGSRQSSSRTAAPRRGDVINVGLADGRILRAQYLERDISGARSRSTTWSMCGCARLPEAGGARRYCASARRVQGAALVLENKTGRLLAMAGAFSYPDSQLNRTVQSVRQPGSTLKPLTYLTALQKGLQPNTLVMDEPITLPPIGAIAAMRARRITGRRRMPMAAVPASSRCGARWRIRAISRPRNLMANGIENTAEQRARPNLRACGRGAALQAMQPLLSVRARRAAVAADRSCGLLRRDRQ